MAAEIAPGATYPSVLASEFRRLTSLKPVALRANSDPLEVYYETDNATWQGFADPVRRPVHGYIFRDHGDIPLHQMRDRRRILPTPQESTGELARKFLGRGSRVPVYGMADLAFVNRGMEGQQIRIGRTAQAAMGSLGHGYLMEPMTAALDGDWITITSPRMTLKVQQFFQGGGIPGRLVLTMPEIGYVDREILLAHDYGAGWSIGEFITERVGQADYFAHNPTQGGSGNNGVPPRLEVIGSPPIVRRMRSLGGIEALLEGLSIPMEFDPDGTIQAPDDHADHGGSYLDPVIWWQMLHGCRIAWNWQQREGVHLYQSFSYAPFALLPSVGGPWFHALNLAIFLLSKFDKAYSYDAGTDTLTQVTEADWKDSHFPNWFRTWTSRVQTTEESYDFSVSPPALLTRTVLPSTTTTGGFASIMRATGTYYGSATDFAIGYYVPLGPTGNGGSQPVSVYSSNFRATFNGPDDTNNPLANTLQAMAAITEDSSRPAGWRAFQTWIVMDTFANVRSKIRQLWLDGHRNSDLGPLSFYQGYGS